MRALGARMTLLAVAYVVTARLGLMLDAESGFATLVWPPTAIAIAAVLLYGYRLWPGVAAGALLINLWIGATLPVALGIAVGNTLEAVVAVYCLQRVDFHRSLDRLRDVAALAVIAAVASTVSATVGVTSLWLGERTAAEQLELTWLVWWWGDLSGAVLALPLLLAWSTAAPPSAIEQPTRAEALALVGTLLVVGTVLFGSNLPTVVEHPYLIVPLLIWAAIRFGPRGASAASAAVAMMAIVGTLSGGGPFLGATVQDRLFDVQPFAVTSALTALAMGAIAVGRAREALSARQSELHVAEAARELARVHAQLEHHVELRTTQLRKALADKDVLLREVHHRVKNNLQVIASLLALQSISSNPELRPAFDESRQRIRSMGLVHELLYRSQELGSIDLGEYLRRVVTSVAGTYGAPHIDFVTKAPELLLDIDAAVPCGLIVNELVSNSLKHAFRDRKRGRIAVEVIVEGDDLVLEVADDGIGLPDIQIANARTLGLRIVHALTQQLHGTVNITREGGTRFRIRLPKRACTQAAA